MSRSRSQQAGDPICTCRLENPGRILQRLANRSCSDYGWLSMDWNAGWPLAFRWRPICSMEVDEGETVVVIPHYRTPGRSRWEPMDRNGLGLEPFGRWQTDPIS